MAFQMITSSKSMIQANFFYYAYEASHLGYLNFSPSMRISIFDVRLYLIVVIEDLSTTELVKPVSEKLSSRTPALPLKTKSMKFVVSPRTEIFLK